MPIFGERVFVESFVALMILMIVMKLFVRSRATVKVNDQVFIRSPVVCDAFIHKMFKLRVVFQ